MDYISKNWLLVSIAVLEFFILIFVISVGIISSDNTNKKLVEEKSPTISKQNVVLNESNYETSKEDYENVIFKASQTELDNPEFKACVQNNINSCIYNRVVDRGINNFDVSVCDDILDPNQKLSCKDEIILNKAKSNLDDNVCKEASNNSKANCIYQINTEFAKSKKDIKICDKIDKEINSYSGISINSNLWSTEMCKYRFNNN